MSSVFVYNLQTQQMYRKLNTLIQKLIENCFKINCFVYRPITVILLSVDSLSFTWQCSDTTKVWCDV